MFDDEELIELSMTSSTPDRELGLPWQDNLDTLAESTALNCPLCTIVHNAVSHWKDRRDAAKKTSYGQEFSSAHDVVPSGKLYLARRYGGGDGFAVFIRIDLMALMLASVAFTADQASPLAEKLLLRPFSQDSGSSGALSVVSSWLKNCHDNHKKCCNDETTLPTRVLAVGCIGDSNIRLIEPDAGTTGKYASLSHCWGSSLMLTTTHTSRHVHMSGIFVSDLPKTFQDAVSVCRHLGIPYLWIDSLCILQDDSEDWARESSRMLGVYSKAYIVIAANHAKGPAEGCFHIRQSRPNAYVELPGIGLAQVQVVRGSNEMLSHYAEFPAEPLTKRAWALQERLLAIRVIHYNTGQMFFECRHGIVSEDGCKIDVPFCDLSPVINHQSSHDECLLTWSSIERYYGPRELTKPTDKLIALSGIAALFGEFLKDEYIAGKWSSQLLEEMAWQGLEKKNAQPITEYVGPSWSWASYNGTAARLYLPNWKSIAIVEDWQVELTNPEDYYGQVKSASVRVRGPLTQLTPSTVPGNDFDERLKRAGLSPRLRFCTKYTRKGLDSELNLDHETETLVVSEGMDIKVLLLGFYNGLQIPQWEEYEEQEVGREVIHMSPAFGLVLTPININGATYMKRIGYIHLDDDEVIKLIRTKEDWSDVTII